MGLRHLVSISEFLEKRFDWVTRTEVRDCLGFNYGTVVGYLGFLWEHGDVDRKEVNGRVLFRWRDPVIRGGRRGE